MPGQGAVTTDQAVWIHGDDGDEHDFRGKRLTANGREWTRMKKWLNRQDTKF
jgi:hypothetical protein